MQIIIGLIFTAGGGWAAWWAFSQPKAGDDFYNWVGPIAIIICILGILLIFLSIRKWWMSE